MALSSILRANRRAVATAVAAGIIGPPGGGGGSKRVLATNIGTSMMEQGVRGGAAVVALGRRPVRLPVAIRRAKMLIPVFSVVTGGSVPGVSGSNTAHVDTFFSNVRSFQRGINAVFNSDHSAAPTGRQLFTFGGAKTAAYDPGTWDQNKVYIESDWLDISIPAGQVFELSNGIRTPAGALPYTTTQFGDKQPGYATLVSNTDIMGTEGLATATGFIPFANANAGGGTFFDNGILLVETTDNVVQVLNVGDSNVYAFGYDVGDAYCVSGALARGAQNRKNWMAVGLGRGSDGDYNHKVVANAALRRKLAAAIHAVAPFKGRTHGHGGNDITKTYTAMPVWAANTAYARGDAVNSAGNGVYICTKGGTSKASGSLTGAGRNIVDGTAEWALLSTDNSGIGQQVGQIAANKMLSMDYWAAALPGVPVIDLPIVPQSATTDNWATVANQTAATANGWGGSTSRRGRVNALTRGKLDLWGASQVMDPNPYVEAGYVAGDTSTETSLWMADGTTPKLYTIDGTHWAETGAIEGSKAIDAITLQP